MNPWMIFHGAIMHPTLQSQWNTIRRNQRRQYYETPNPEEETNTHPDYEDDELKTSGVEALEEGEYTEEEECIEEIQLEVRESRKELQVIRELQELNKSRDTCVVCESKLTNPHDTDEKKE